MTNRLAEESSPYLRAHSTNPVDWYPWCAEAMERARKEDRPIFLSIGYSACHWCHVMERESFQDPETAELLNGNFVSIKVDREERPDIDGIYMDAVQAMTGRGGWPLNVFLLPDGTPFFGGTYFPPDSLAGRYGTQGFPTVLRRILQVFRDNREDLVTSGKTVVRILSSQSAAGELSEPDTGLLTRAAENISAGFDRRYGGFGGAPKFPMPMVLEFLLRIGNGEALKMALLSLERMALGGIFDHLGGGFHRYSTDRRWLVPHFEKMLCDNALLGRIFTEAFQMTGDPLFSRTASKTLDFMLREMECPHGGFCSSLDADSEPSQGSGREEGAFYTWTPGEVTEALGARGKEFCAVYNLGHDGVLRGRGIPHLSGYGKEAVEMEGCAGRLLEHRERRPRPFRDGKVVTSWNGEAIRTLAAASVPLGRPDFLQAAVRAADFVLERLRRTDGMIMHCWPPGSRAVPGFLNDHSLFARGLLELYRVSGDLRFLSEAERTAEFIPVFFRQGDTGRLGQTGREHEKLFLDHPDQMDNAIPSGTSAAAELFLQLWQVTGSNDFLTTAEDLVSARSPLLERHPSGFGRMLSAIHFLLSDTRRVVLSGSGKEEFLRVLNRGFFPLTVLAPQDRPHKGPGSATVCGRGYCLPAVSSPGSLPKLLK